MWVSNDSRAIQHKEDFLTHLNPRKTIREIYKNCPNIKVLPHVAFDGLVSAWFMLEIDNLKETWSALRRDQEHKKKHHNLDPRQQEREIQEKIAALRKEYLYFSRELADYRFVDYSGSIAKALTRWINKTSASVYNFYEEWNNSKSNYTIDRHLCNNYEKYVIVDLMKRDRFCFYELFGNKCTRTSCINNTAIFHDLCFKCQDMKHCTHRCTNLPNWMRNNYHNNNNRWSNNSRSQQGRYKQNNNRQQKWDQNRNDKNKYDKNKKPSDARGNR